MITNATRHKIALTLVQKVQQVLRVPNSVATSIRTVVAWLKIVIDAVLTMEVTTRVSLNNKNRRCKLLLLYKGNKTANRIFLI